MTATRQSGIVKAIHLDRGFGFIAVVGSRDEFFHCTDLAGGLEFDDQLTGRRVTFDVSLRNDGRTKAVDVRPGE